MSDEDDRRIARAKAHAAFAERAQAQRCPKCNRLSALVSLPLGGGATATVCKFCSFTKKSNDNN